MAASEAQNQMSIRSAKVAILLSSMNRQLRSLSNNHHYHQQKQSDETEVVVNLKRKVEDLKIELVTEKSKCNKMSCCSIFMKFLLLQISCFILTLVLCFVSFNRVNISVTLE